MSLPQDLQAAWREHKEVALQSLAIYRSYCTRPIPRVAGCDTSIRLAHRIAHGFTVEEAAAREYVYRWGLAILPGNQVTCGSSVCNEYGERADAEIEFVHGQPQNGRNSRKARATGSERIRGGVRELVRKVNGANAPAACGDAFSAKPLGL